MKIPGSNIEINESCIKEEFIRSSGPGGQNVNKVSTAVQLKICINDISLPYYARGNLLRLAKNMINSENELVLSSYESRSQNRNREIVREKLLQLLAKCLERPKKRIKTKATKASKERRLKEKKKRSDVKKNRKTVDKY